MGWISRPRARWRAATGLVATALLGALSVTALGATPAAANSLEGVGHRIDLDPPHHYDWLGTYKVKGKDVFCVSFHLTAPDSNEEYKPGEELKTKWGEPLKPDVAANISYLLLRYGNTQNRDEAAALAHLLHSWTAPSVKPGDTDTNQDPKDVAYNEKDYFGRLQKQWPTAADDVAKLKTEAEANRGPWTASVTTPKGDQHLGQPATWTVTVKNSKGKGIPNVPVTLNATDGTIAKADKPATDASAKESSAGNSAPQSAKADETLKTDENGTVTVSVTPTGDQPKLAAALETPAEKPIVQEPTHANGTVQNVVGTGGEKKLTAQGVVAVAKPGKVQVTKTDAKTGKGIGGATLRVTATDRKSPATSQDGKP
ncbi:MAG: hypothetical protein LBV34_21195, partial [Nocardiopsaceae bacterium]|nr:hypothetical protein [Nocardiopsaceae bacterium]